VNGDGRQDLLELRLREKKNWRGIPYYVEYWTVSLALPRPRAVGDHVQIFEEPRKVPLPEEDVWWPSNKVVVLDVNDDGKEDIFYGGRLLLGTATGLVDAGLDGDLATVRRYEGVDVDGDGRRDIVSVGPWVFRNRGDGSFDEGVFVPPVGGICGMCRVHDLDGDGVASVVQILDGSRYELRHLGAGSYEFQYAGPWNDPPIDFTSNFSRSTDLNGDALEDLVQLRTNKGKNAAASLHYNSGRGYVGAPSFSHFAFSDGETFSRSITWDSNADGRQELWVPTKTLGWLRIDPFGYYNSQNGPTWEIELGTLPFPWVRNEVYAGYYQTYFEDIFGFAHPTVIDTNGDGIAELLQRVPNAEGDATDPVLQIAETLEAPVRMTAITNGLGQRTTVAYERDGAESYTRGTGCKWPVRCLPRPIEPVVTWVTTEGETLGQDLTATTAQRAWSYHYEDARSTVHGRGALGFAKIKIDEYQGGSPAIVRSEVREFDLNTYDEQLKLHPFAGVVKATQVTTTTPGNALNGNQPVSHRIRSATTRALRRTSQGRPYLAVTGTTVTRFENDRSTQASSTTFDNFDDFGNAKLITQSWSDAAKVTTELTYTTETHPQHVTDWLLRRPEKRTVTGWVFAGNPALGQKKVEHRWQYDPQGRVKKASRTTPSDGQHFLITYESTEYDYDLKFGNVTQVTRSALNAETQVSHITYDARGIAPRTMQSGLHKDAGLRAVRITHDFATGAVRVVEAPDGSWVVTNTDRLGRTTSSISSSGDNTTIVRRSGRNTVGPAMPLELEVSGFEQPTVVTKLDELGRTVMVRAQDFAASETWQLTGYDQRGRVAAESRPYAPENRYSSWAPTHGQVTYGYDNLHRLLVAFTTSRTARPS
jgi:hypothetical protein